MNRTRTASLLVTTCLLAASCASSDDADDGATPEAGTAVVTEAPSVTEAPVYTDPVPELPTEAQPITIQPRGTDALVSTQSFDDTVAAAVAAVEGNENLTLVANIDHSANADTAGIELPPTTELIFGNPALGTPLMALEPTAGIDLPQKMLIVEDLDGTVTVSWNRSEYLASRHGLSAAVDEQLATIDGALLALATEATASAPETPPIESVTVVGEREGLVETTAPGTARDAADRLVAAIDGNENLTLVAEIDHGANAAAAGSELTPIIEVIFGNPALGTPMMLASRSVAIDLPQKMLFIEDGDSVRIIYNDPEFVAKRHKIDRDVELIVTVRGALEGLADAAAG